MGIPSPKIASSHRSSGPQSYTWFLGAIRANNPNGISISSAISEQMTEEHSCTLQWAILPPKNCPFPWGILTPSNMSFLGPNRILNPNGTSISSAIFAGLTSVTDRSTDHATRSVTRGRIYMRCSLIIVQCYPNLIFFIMWSLMQKYDEQDISTPEHSMG